jgi:transcriptional antiterminator RfaH
MESDPGMSLIQTSTLLPTAGRSAESPSRTVELAAAGTPSVSAARWHVLHTRSRQEKALARTLAAAGIHHELPLTSRMRFYGHRKREVREPLFTNYLFMQGPPESAWFALATKRVANVIAVHDQATFERELGQIRIALAGGAELQPHGYLTVGRRVRVTSGPFKDVEGLIEDTPKPDRLVLQIDVLGRAASLEIDAGLLEPLD